MTHDICLQLPISGDTEQSTSVHKTTIFLLANPGKVHKLNTSFVPLWVLSFPFQFICKNTDRALSSIHVHRPCIKATENEVRMCSKLANVLQILQSKSSVIPHVVRLVGVGNTGLR